MTLKQWFKRFIRRYVYIYEELDTEGAAHRIKSGIWFRGPNVWILAFSIIIASVGLNVNSTAVIIGAMLISPLMGPIIGVGLSLGTNDVELLKSAAKNLMVMVLVSLFASTLFFILSPLSLVNPTELEARTTPTIYDVLIALFGGLAGILENSRKERGTVLSGVAIATALMPPLCTAGYGLAHWNMHFFLGALYLFVINSVFIAMATYFMVKYLRFPTVAGIDQHTVKRRSRVISAILFVVVVPSIWGAFVMIQENNFERNVQTFIENDRLVGPRTYVTNYKINSRHNVVFNLAGEPLSDSLKTEFYIHARQYGIQKQDITLTEHSLGMSQQDMDIIIDEIYAKTDAEIDKNEALVHSMQGRMNHLEHRLDGLASMNDSLFTSNQFLQHQLDSLSKADRKKKR